MIEEINEQPKKIKQRLNESRYDRSLIMENADRRKVLNQSVLQSNLIDCEQTAEKAVELILYNKINAKNAFDVNVEYLERLSHLLNKNEESSWQKASASLDASAKIYGYRVDSVHSETFKILGGLNRADAKDENNQDADGEKKERREKMGKHDGYLTIERDPRKLDLVKYELEFDVDPLFKSMTARFSEAGARGLLLNNLPLDNSLDILLECKEKEQEEEKKQNNNLSEISTEIRSAIDKTLSEFSLTDLMQIQICPDLNYFKKSRDLETSLEKTFYQNLMHEIDDNTKGNFLNDRSMQSDSLDESMNIADNIDQDNMSIYSQNMSQDSPSSPDFEDNINIINISKDVINVGPSYLDGFSYIKSDEIKEYIHRFGDGNKETLRNLPHFRTFANSLNQLDKWNGVLKSTSLDPNKKDQLKRVKKEEKLFDFNSDNEVNIKEIFEKEKKIVKENTAIHKKEIIKKRKVKQFYHYDQSNLFNLFSIRDHIIQDPSNNNDGNNTLREDRQDEGEHNQYDNGQDDYDNAPEQPSFEENKENIKYNQTFAKIDNEYEKKFGRLYKTFDVRFIKSKIWESLSDLNKLNKIETNKRIDFKDIIGNVSNNLTKDIINNISTPTCFVCLLHLSNEKNLTLEEVDDNNFVVRLEAQK